MNIFSRSSRRHWLPSEQNQALMNDLRTGKWRHKCHRRVLLASAIQHLEGGRALRAIDYLTRAFDIDQLRLDSPERIEFYVSIFRNGPRLTKRY